MGALDARQEASMNAARRGRLGMVLGITLGLLASPARATPADDEAICVKGIELAERLVVVAKGAKGDCERMVSDMVAFLEDRDNAATLEDMKAARARMSEAQKEALKAKYGARLEAAVRNLARTAGPCEGSPAAKKAAKKLNGRF
jgi:hypothetical protein